MERPNDMWSNVTKLFNAYKVLAGIIGVFATIVAWNNSRITANVITTDKLNAAFIEERAVTRAIVDSAVTRQDAHYKAMADQFLQEYLRPMMMDNKALLEGNEANAKLLKEVVRSQQATASRSRLLSLMERDSVLRENERLKRELATQRAINDLRSIIRTQQP